MRGRVGEKVRFRYSVTEVLGLGYRLGFVYSVIGVRVREKVRFRYSVIGVKVRERVRFRYSHTQRLSLE